MAIRRLTQLRIAKEQKRATAAKDTAKELPPPILECDRFARYRTDPVAFAIEKLRIDLYPRQQEILRAICNTKKNRVAVRSGHKCGKSIVAVIAALWTACCFPRARVILTALSGFQVRNVLWKELTRIYRDAGGHAVLGGHLAKTPAGGFKFEDGREIIGFSVDKAENMAGYSGPHVLWIVDEASGFDERIFEAIEGNAQSGARIFVISNPTKTVGFFFDAFHSRAAEWERFKISSEEAAEYAERIPGLSTLEEVKKRIDRLGRDHPIIRVRVLGEFPGSGDNTIVSLHLVEGAHETWKETVSRQLAANNGNIDPAIAETLRTTGRVGLDVLAKCTGPELGPLELGVDVARFGDDDTVIQARRGKFLFPQTIIHGFDNVEVAGATLAVSKHLRTMHERVSIKVDGIGAGAGVVDQLRASVREDPTVKGFLIHDVNVSVKADDEEKWPNLRSQLWFAIADFLEDGGTLPPSNNDDEEGALDAELMAPTYKFDGRGRQVVEPKADTKKRLKRSPDRADAVALAVYKATSGGPTWTSNRSASRYADMGGFGRG